MQTTFMDGQWSRTYQCMDLNGRREKTLPLKKYINLSKKTREVSFNGENENWLVEKLVPNLKDRKGYVVHIKALDQALRHGLKL